MGRVLIRQYLLLVSGVLAMIYAGAAAAIDWPQKLEAEKGTIVVYQPQPESLKGDVLTGRAAMSIALKDGSEPIFGAMWFSSRIESSGDSVLVRDVKITAVTWPDAKETNRDRFTQFVENAIPDAGFEISHERLAASLGVAQDEIQSLKDINNDPPKIIFEQRLAVLLLFDGDPKFDDIENSPYQRAVNTPFAVVHDTKGGKYYLSSGVLWYRAEDPLGPWEITDSPPQDLVKNMPEPGSDQQAPAGRDGMPPIVVVATEPTELISTDGEPEWKPLPDGELIYAVNTETPWIRDVAGSQMYVLLSGRWFASQSQEGPWKFVRADKLPDSFKQIPPNSDIGGVRTSVAGTDEAEQAVLDAQIPETAAISRSEAKLEVIYDGEPKFEKIEGTSVAYAVNTSTQVLEIDGKYYAVDDGVWFVAEEATGPWVVADTIPKEEISKIPPSSPVYNTTYVDIYASTPDVVYVGYTPGYLWSFPYWGVPIYGTGWYYPPYWGGFYYPRPPTWGLHVGYNPWTGWNFGVSWTNGFFSFGVSFGGGYGHWGCCGGWYGGGYHRGPTFINTGDINIGNNINVGNRTEIANRIGDNQNFQNLRDNGGRNVYNRGDNAARNVDRATARENLKMAQPAVNRENNVLVDRNNNIARKTDEAWQTRENGQWKNVDTSKIDTSNIDGSRVDTSKISQGHIDTSNIADYKQSRGNVDVSGLERHNRARSRGAQHEMRARHAGGGGGRLRRR